MGAIYLSRKVDLDKFCKENNWTDSEDSIYREDDVFGEYISIRKDTREVYNNGFVGYLCSLISEGIFVNELEPDYITFPHTIGEITFRSKKELEDWVLNAYKTLFKK